MRKLFTVETRAREELVDITEEVRSIVESSGIHSGIVSLYVQGATAALMIQENWEALVRTDVEHLLQKLIPRGVGCMTGRNATVVPTLKPVSSTHPKPFQ